MAAARALLEERYFDTIKLFERNSVAGGLWNYTEYTDEDIRLPSVDPNVSNSPFVDADGNVKGWATAAYDALVSYSII